MRNCTKDELRWDKVRLEVKAREDILPGYSVIVANDDANQVGGQGRGPAELDHALCTLSQGRHVGQHLDR